MDIKRNLYAALLIFLVFLSIPVYLDFIGVEQGPVLMGSIGPAHRRAHTLCGETVSVTLRIQEMTADLASPILVGEVAARYISDVKLESLGHFLLPGLVSTHVLYAPSVLRSSTRENLTLLVGV